MKQITPEIKARVFALYWGQSVGLIYIPPHIHMAGKPLTVYGPQFNSLVEKGYSSCLEVKPLSSITDEDAIEVAKLVTDNRDWIGRIHYTALATSVTLVKPNTTINVTIDISDDGDIWDSRLINHNTLSGHDYLRSKGYALPAFGYSVDELAEAGVFKLKEVNND